MIRVHIAHYDRKKTWCGKAIDLISNRGVRPKDAKNFPVPRTERHLVTCKRCLKKLNS